HGARFYVLDIPGGPDRQSHGHVTSSFDLVDQSIVSSLHVVHPEGELDKLLDKGVETFYHKGPGHFTPSGYHAVAAALFDAMRSADAPPKGEETSTSAPVGISISSSPASSLLAPPQARDR